MSSTYKTENLRLNKWLGSDVPQREDFNDDNRRIDDAVSTHIGDTDSHLQTEERSRWNTPYYLGTYTGNGANTRTITTNCPFQPTWGLVFATNKLPSVEDFDNQADYNYFGLVSSRGSTVGVSLTGSNLAVVQSSIAVSGFGYRNFNENGQMYIYILFR